MSISRRNVLKAAVAAGIAGVALPLYFGRSPLAGVSPQQFVNPLGIPPVMSGRMEGDVKIFDLQLQRGTSQFLPGKTTQTAGINADFLGPVVRVKRGDNVRLNVANKLGEPSTLHWHGLHLPAKMDGGPHQTIENGATWSPEFDIRQQASTQWFHSHMYHGTAEQVYFGLAGLFYIDDDESSRLNIPDDYGVDDIPLILQDRSFNRDGSFSYMTSMRDQMRGMLGDVMLVNGVAHATHEVKSQRMRFRLLNGSNARIYNLEFSDQREFKQIATDGGLLAQPVSLRALRLAPGERAEIVVEFAANDDVLLAHKPLPKRDNSGGGMMARMMNDNDEPFYVMRFSARNAQPAQGSLPNKLVAVRSWAESAAVKKRSFMMDMSMGMGMGSGGGFTINGKSMDIKRIDEVIKLNDVEIWEIGNNSPMAHPLHIHDIQFRILDRDGRPPAANEQGLKDTVLVDPGETVRIITQFENFADAENPYMFHCHILEHEDAGMMGQFLVVA